jgi:proteasome alpha subunit
MIEEPYRWVEAIANRREYIEDQLHRGSPVVLLGFSDGLLLLTVSRKTRKVFEIYDRIGFAALGHPADIERMRMIAIDLAHIEGFNRAVNDVSLHRLVSFGMSPALKGAFEQVYGAPYIVKILLAELGEDSDRDSIVKLDYDGSIGGSEAEVKEFFDVIAGTEEAERQMVRYLADSDADPHRSLEKALQLAALTWAVGMETAERSDQAEREEGKTEKIDAVKALKEHLKTRRVEAAVLDRNRPTASKFLLLEEKELRSALKDL